MRKDELIGNLIEIRQKILDLVSSLPCQQQDEVFLGSWSVKDILAHLIGWDYWNVKAVKELLRGRLPSVYLYYDADWASFNARLVRKYEGRSLRGLLRALGRSQQKLVSLLKMIPAREFSKDRGLEWRGSKVTIVGELKVELDDEKVHYKQMQNWLGR